MSEPRLHQYVYRDDKYSVVNLDILFLNRVKRINNFYLNYFNLYKSKKDIFIEEQKNQLKQELIKDLMDSNCIEVVELNSPEHDGVKLLARLAVTSELFYLNNQELIDKNKRLSVENKELIDINERLSYDISSLDMHNAYLDDCGRILRKEYNWLLMSSFIFSVLLVLIIAFSK